jgi:SAM-dependent methyltransferase
MALGRAFWMARSFASHAADNALAWASPRLASAARRLANVTGRGTGREGDAAVSYFEAVADDYDVIAAHVGVAERGELYRGRRALELGPGNTRALALLARLAGAAGCEAFDPFDVQARRAEYLQTIYGPLLSQRGQEASLRRSSELLQTCAVHTSEPALRAAGRRFDLVLSRAVLEHVRDLGALFGMLAAVTTDDAVLIHKVDLRCHGNRHEHELDFLSFPEPVYRIMSSHVDVPNRARLPTYLTLAEGAGLSTLWAASTHVIDRAEAEVARPRLAAPFRAMGAEALSILGLWLVQVGPAHPLARVARPLRPCDVGPAPHDRLSAY